MTTSVHPITDRQAQILRFLCGHKRREGIFPTFDEIRAEFGIGSRNGITCHLGALAKKGYIERAANHARGIRIVGEKCPACVGLGLIPVRDEDQPPLTRRQTDLLCLILDHMVRTGSSPSVRELCVQAGIRSPNGIKVHLAGLGRKGRIRVQPFASRAIRLVGEECETCKGLGVLAPEAPGAPG